MRKGEIVHRSEEQQHYFNTPFQLSLPPPGHGDNVLSDSPESADTLSFSVKNGDVILVATDGVFDNVPTNLLLDTLKEIEGERDSVKLQMTANSIALMARSLSFDSEFMSPFAINARRNNIHTTGKFYAFDFKVKEKRNLFLCGVCFSHSLQWYNCVHLWLRCCQISFDTFSDL